MRLLATRTSYTHWQSASYYTESWFIGADYSKEYKYLYIRLLGVELTLGWK